MDKSKTDPARPAPPKPMPVPTPESAPFWTAAGEHRLLIPCCQACGKSWFPPARLCPHCLSDNTGWRGASGRGHVFSFVVFHRLYDPAFANEVPYTVAIVELDEGARMLSNIVGIPPDEVEIGLPVFVLFDDVSARTSIPKFSPRPQHA